MTVWAARVAQPLAQEVWTFLRADDGELLEYDCAATAQHARRLHAAGLLERRRCDVEARLDEIAAEGEVGDADEDVHSAIERLLGPLGRKIHAGRSRNDQVAAALRLYVADACQEARTALEGLARAILERAAEELRRPCPATRTCSGRSP